MGCIKFGPNNSNSTSIAGFLLLKTPEMLKFMKLKTSNNGGSTTLRCEKKVTGFANFL